VDVAGARYIVSAMSANETFATRAGRVLAWYEAMGVDAALQESPVDWMARGARAPGAEFSLAPAQNPQSSTHGSGATPQQAPARAPAAPASRPPRRFTGKPSAPTAADARGAIANVRTLAELESALKDFEGCGLKATAKNLCFYRGAEHARLMIIGEAPGRDEDLAGKPFVGRAGLLLDKMLAAIGLSENDVHITNIVYWRPPGNRTPTPQEALACRPFLERQAELVAPDVVLALGGAAAKQLFDTSEGIMRLRGKWRQIELGGHKVRAMATLHPAYLLRTPAAKGMAWRDLLAVKAALKPAH
jgi:uracil-DNA glycosylase family 4